MKYCVASRRRLLSVRAINDFVGRYGGEEFLIVLNNCDSSQAIARAEEVRDGIANRPIQTLRGPLSITMSLGVLSSRDWNLHLAEETLGEVDAALYRAKAAGRNCVVLRSHTPVRCFRAAIAHLTGTVQSRRGLASRDAQCIHLRGRANADRTLRRRARADSHRRSGCGSARRAAAEICKKRLGGLIDDIFYGCANQAGGR